MSGGLRREAGWLWRRGTDLLDPRLLRFLCVGATNFLISFAVFQGLLLIPRSSDLLLPAYQLVSYGAGIVWSYFWNRRFTFGSRQPWLREGSRFLVLQVCLALLSAALIGALVNILGLGPTISWLAVMSFITVVNFLASKLWVFAATGDRH